MKASKRRKKGDGRIIERGTNRYLARVFLGRDSKGKRCYKSKLIRGTEDEARQWIKEIKALLTLRQINIDSSSETISQFLDRWLQFVIKPNRATKTFEGYQWLVEQHLKKGLGSSRVVDLRPEKIQAFYATLKPATAQHCHSALRAALNVAVKWEVLKHNPALQVETPQHLPREIPFLTAEEITTLLEHAKGQYRALFAFMVSSGVRPGEAFALRWTDLDEAFTTAKIQRSVSWRESGGYHFTPLKTSRKTKKRGRSVSLPAGLGPVLREHRAQQAEWFIKAGIRSELVFCSDTGGPLHPRNVTMRGLKPALKAAELPTIFTLYSLRHSFASVMLTLGAHIKLVSEMLGHSRVDITLDTYSHLMPGLQEEVATRLDRALYPQSSVRTANTPNSINTSNNVSRTNSTNTLEQVA